MPVHTCYLKKTSQDSDSDSDCTAAPTGGCLLWIQYGEQKNVTEKMAPIVFLSFIHEKRKERYSILCVCVFNSIITLEWLFAHLLSFSKNQMSDLASVCP